MTEDDTVFEVDSKDTGTSFDGAGIIQVGRNSYAYGLQWSVATDEVSGRGFLPYVRKAAVDEGADLICIEGQNAFGLGTTAAGHARGMRPLATSLSYGLTDPFLAAFRIEGHGMYVLASRDGHILPGCERLFANEEDARAFFVDMMQRTHWAQLVAPQDMSLSGTTEMDIAEILGSSRSKVRLVDATRRTFVLRAVAATLAIVLTGAGYYGYTTWQNIRQNALHAAQVAKAAQDIARERARHAAEVAAQTWPYDKQPIGAFSIAACQSDILHLDYSVPGWQAKKVKCNPLAGTVSVSYQQTYGTINWILGFLEKHSVGTGGHDVKVDTSLDEKSATATWKFDNFTHRYGHHDPNMNVSDEWSFLKRGFAEYGMNPKMEIVTPKPQSPVRKSGNPSPDMVVFSHLDVNWDSEFQPTEFMNLIAPLQAFVVNDVSVDIEKGRWSVSGNVYQKIIEQSNTNRGYNQMIPFNKNAMP